MSKTKDIIFDNEEEFLTNNPAFAVVKSVPNYAAIRAVLKAKQTLKGVRFSIPETSTEQVPDFIGPQKRKV